ncbi:MAG: ABC transporter ATP-binding protein [Chloroflexi bacterium]|nr:ABC transporter ATP-binding protein [Chloroflexota bacterium]
MLEVRDIWKTYEGQPLLQGISFSVEQGETICLLGPSGSGKSTLLRIITGLEQAERGQVLWQGQDLRDVPVHKRNFGLMFQDYALFPHKNVAENVAFGLKMQHVPAAEQEHRVKAALEQVNMAAFARRRVTDLSGGEQQRVALARALVPRPGLLMLDEPLGALDRSLRSELIEELRQLLRQTGIPAIYVTHDQEEAFTIADRIFILSEGNIIQQGTPQEVFQNPASTWVAHFLGLSNLVSGKLISLDPPVIDTGDGPFEAHCLPIGQPPSVGQAVHLLLPVDHISLQGPDGAHNCLHGLIQDVVFRSGAYHYKVYSQGGSRLDFVGDQALDAGESIAVYIPPERIRCMR